MGSKDSGKQHKDWPDRVFYPPSLCLQIDMSIDVPYGNRWIYSWSTMPIIPLGRALWREHVVVSVYLVTVPAVFIESMPDRSTREDKVCGNVWDMFLSFVVTRCNRGSVQLLFL